MPDTLRSNENPLRKADATESALLKAEIDKVIISINEKLNGEKSYISSQQKQVYEDILNQLRRVDLNMQRQYKFSIRVVHPINPDNSFAAFHYVADSLREITRAVRFEINAGAIALDVTIKPPIATPLTSPDAVTRE